MHNLKKQKHRFASDNTCPIQRQNHQQQQIPGQHLPGPIKCGQIKLADLSLHIVLDLIIYILFHAAWSLRKKGRKKISSLSQLEQIHHLKVGRKINTN